MLNYVPAGVEAYSKQRTQLNIKLEKNDEETTEFGRKYKRWRTFDKTITCTVSSTAGTILSKAPSDIIVPLFSPTFVSACGLTKILANDLIGRALRNMLIVVLPTTL